ncbi:MAG: glycosyltransferase family 2 protein [Methanoregula sp.]|nr:MAG: glycosyltransferase family 2 protein [Methanoregula sp.]
MDAPPDIRYSLVIPAYNEEARIAPLFDQIGEFTGELIVVCDGKDHTPDVVMRISAARPDLTIRCLTFSRRLGKGGGVIEGIKAARGEFVGYFDADGSTGIGEMMMLFKQLSVYDGAIGSRWVRGAVLNVKQGVLRQLESRVFNLIIRLLFGLRYHDTQCGAKVFRRHAVGSVLPRMVSTGFEFDVELLWRLQRGGYVVGEFPIQWQNTGDSRVRRRDMIGMVAGLIRVRFCPERP